MEVATGFSRRLYSAPRRLPPSITISRKNAIRTAAMKPMTSSAYSGTAHSCPQDLI